MNVHTRGRKWNDFDRVWIFYCRIKEGEVRRIILEWKTIFLSLECRMPYNFIVRVLTITRGKYFRDKSQLVTQVYY